MVRNYFSILVYGSGHLWCAPTLVTPLTNTKYCQVTTWRLLTSATSDCCNLQVVHIHHGLNINKTLESVNHKGHVRDEISFNCGE